MLASHHADHGLGFEGISRPKRGGLVVNDVGRRAKSLSTDDE
jgi:hypothetical protein